MIGRFPLKTVITFISRNEGKGILSEKSQVKGKLRKIFELLRNKQELEEA